MKKVLFVVLVIVVSKGAFAGSITGAVTQVGTALDSWGTPDVNQKGVFTFNVGGLPKACGSGYGRIVIPTDHPLYNTVVSMVLSAQAQKRSVIANYLNSCTYRSNSWDFGTLSIQ